MPSQNPRKVENHWDQVLGGGKLIAGLIRDDLKKIELMLPERLRAKNRWILWLRPEAQQLSQFLISRWQQQSLGLEGWNRSRTSGNIHFQGPRKELRLTSCIWREIAGCGVSEPCYLMQNQLKRWEHCMCPWPGRSRWKDVDVPFTGQAGQLGDRPFTTGPPRGIQDTRTNYDLWL